MFLNKLQRFLTTTHSNHFDPPFFFILLTSITIATFHVLIIPHNRFHFFLFLLLCVLQEFNFSYFIKTPLVSAVVSIDCCSFFYLWQIISIMSIPYGRSSESSSTVVIEASCGLFIVANILLLSTADLPIQINPCISIPINLCISTKIFP